MAETEKKKRPAIFALVGVGNTLIDFSFYTLLTLTVFKDGHNIAIAGVISGTFALFIAFGLHSFITWRDRPINRRTFLKFVAFTGFGQWVVRPLLLATFIHLGGVYRFTQNISDALHLPFSYHFIANTGAFGFMTLVILIYNYSTYSRFVFNTKDNLR